MGMHVVNLELELLSPCFLGGAHQQPEFRIGSLRGLWRYWYRALYGDGTEAKRPVDGERQLFGDIARSKGERLPRARARLLPRQRLGDLSSAMWERGRPPRGRDYLLFTMDMNKRGYLKPGQKIRFALRVSGTSEDADRVSRSLAAALSFGGIGARSRRMAGAVHLVAESRSGCFPTEPATDPPSLAGRLAGLIAPVVERRLPAPTYHVVAKGHFVAGVLAQTFTTWESALDAGGTILREFRRRRPPDYAVAKGLMQRQQPGDQQTITRTAFGLPLTFRFSSLPQLRMTVQLTNSDRRGSPLFLTLERLKGGRVAVVWSLFRTPLTLDGNLQAVLEAKRATDGWKREWDAVLPAPSQEALDKLLGSQKWTSHKITE
jgi:hypothetical protein